MKMKTVVALASAGCLFFLFVSLTEGQSGNKTARASAFHHVIELLLVADYSAFKGWYDKTPSTDSVSKRTTDATNNLKAYLGSLYKSSNIAYNSLIPHNIYIQIKLVDILVMTRASDAPWTETIKVRGSPKYRVDPTAALPLFKTKSIELQSTIPHDHAMLFTLYSLWQGSGGTFSGYAYTDAECLQKSLSIVEDNEDFYTAQLMAHEIGHSLGCLHDGDRNPCPKYQGYTMEASFILANKNKWTFSTCSVDYIRNYLQTLNQHHNNCLKTIQNHKPNPAMTQLMSPWYGQIYTADEQCQLHFGKASYLCRDLYYKDYSTICLKLKCYDPDKRSCYYIDGGDGTPCGNGKWCMSDECVTDSKAPAVPAVFERLGKTPALVSETDMELIEAFVVVMYDRSTKTFDVNELRLELFAGKQRHYDSILPTRGALIEHTRRVVYQGGYVWAQSILKEQQLPNPGDWGWVKESPDGLWVPKWTQFPAIAASCQELLKCGCKKPCSDGCAAGDQPGIVKNGMTCQQLVNRDSSVCRSNDVKYPCCDSCNPSSSHVTSNPGHVTSNPGHVTSNPGQHITTNAMTTSSSNHHISTGTIDDQCARRHGSGSYLCRGATRYDGKPYSDTVCWDLQCHDPTRSNWCLSSPADDRTPCGNGKWCINKRCIQDSRAPSVPDNCPYGDQPSGVVAFGLTCSDLKHPQYHWRCYDDYMAKVCCESCQSIKRNIQSCPYGDKSDWCQRNIASQRDKQTCYWGNNSDLCCESCGRYENNAHAGCEYGDKTNSCRSISCSTYSSSQRSKCCETCMQPSFIG